MGILILFMLGSCTRIQMPVNNVKHAFAVLQSVKGSGVSGIVYFDDEGNGTIRVEASVDGLSPGKHGFHIHEYGDCDMADLSLAGGHFNPEGVRHGGPESEVHHAGDMGNLVADSAGHAHLVLFDPDIAFSGTHDILGRSVIIHAGEDDLQSQPSGNSGARIACGIIAVSNPDMRASM